MAVWRYTGLLMGIPETILFRDADEALKLYDIGLMCEPNSPPIESVAMAHSLVNSAPLIAGRTDPADRRNLAKYVYRVSRGLIGGRDCRLTDVPATLRLWSCVVVQGSKPLWQHPGETVSGPSQKQQLRKIHVLARHFVIRRRKESGTHCLTTSTRKSPPSGETGGGLPYLSTRLASSTLVGTPRRG